MDMPGPSVAAAARHYAKRGRRSRDRCFYYQYNSPRQVPGEANVPLRRERRSSLWAAQAAQTSLIMIIMYEYAQTGISMRSANTL